MSDDWLVPVGRLFIPLLADTVLTVYILIIQLPCNVPLHMLLNDGPGAAGEVTLVALPQLLACQGVLANINQLISYPVQLALVFCNMVVFKRGHKG